MVQPHNASQPVPPAPHSKASAPPERASDAARVDRDGPTMPPEPVVEGEPTNWEDLAGRTFGDFEFLKEIGRGGMGIVYKARQKSLDRIVALKVLLADRFRNPALVSRFLAEAQAAAALTHPNIVTIFQVGQCPAGNFYVMEYLEGETLDVLIYKRTIPVHWAVTLLIRISEAAHYAHSRGIVHRDLKPSNIIIDRYRGPVILDFGIAKFVGKVASESEYGMITGTPAFMAPEQAREGDVPAGPHSDVYSLGAVLYTALTRRRTFEEPNPIHAILRVISPEMPPPVRALRPEVPAELEEICMKCLAKRPENRYPSAQALAQALRRFRSTLAAPKPAPQTPPPRKASPTQPVLMTAELLDIARAGQSKSSVRPPDAGDSAATGPDSLPSSAPGWTSPADQGTPAPRVPAAPAQPPAADVLMSSELLEIERTGRAEPIPSAPPDKPGVELRQPPPRPPSSVGKATMTGGLTRPTPRVRLPSVLLVSRAGDQRVRLFKPVTLIGRAPECDIVLKASDVSKRHCQILLQPEDQVFVEDLESVNGTRVNGYSVKRSALKDGDRLDIARHAFQILMAKAK